MSNELQIRPHISVLNQQQMSVVHDHSIQILSSVGLKVDSQRAVQAFVQAGATVDDDRVRIPAKLVQWAINTAPTSIDIYDRRGNSAFELGDGAETRFGIGVTSLNYQDPMTDAITQFQRNHMETMVRLGESLPSFDSISTVGVIQDI
ncbi:MAG: hypothetical protein GY906_29455, partial [bacterium]|nr:hypothetical protein [bacterium]